MVVIRLSRGGAKKRPFYHIVVADKARSLKGRFIERLGYFNPIATGQDVRLRLDFQRAEQWIAKGAQATDRVKHLMKIYAEEAAKESTAAQK